MSEPKASEPKKKTITEYTFYFVGGQSTVVAIESDDELDIADDDGRNMYQFHLKDRDVYIRDDQNVLWLEVREYKVPVKEPAGPPQTQPGLYN